MLCPHCSQPSDFLFEATDRNRGISGSFRYFRGPCGLVFLANPPTNLSDYYEGGYQRIPRDEAELAQMAAPEGYRLEEILKHKHRGAFLEIGPWIGLTSYNALKSGFTVHAMEIDPRCVSLLRTVGVRATETDDPARTLTDETRTYDVIVLWHSIEHLPRPWTVIERACEKLKPGGLLLVAAPNPESAQMGVLKAKWYHLDAPRHLHLLPMSMIEEIARSHGLETVVKTTDDHLGEILDRDGWWRSLDWRTNLPVLRTLQRMLAVYRARAKFRRAGDLAGAGFTMMFRASA